MTIFIIQVGPELYRYKISRLATMAGEGCEHNDQRWKATGLDNMNVEMLEAQEEYGSQT